MAKIVWDAPRLPTGAGLYTTVQSGLVVISYANGATDTITGDFTYAAGFITGGFITDQQVMNEGGVAISITNARIPAIAYFNARTGNDFTTMANLIFGGSDEIFGAGGPDLLPGGPGEDTIIALDGNDTIDGGAGNDDVNGNVGADLVYGGDGADFVRGGKDADTIYGDAGDDPHVNGNIGNDLVYGGAGNDTVYGGQDQDTLHGDSGDDLLSGDLGADILYGEAGADRFVLRAGGGTDWVADFNASAGDRIQLSPGAAYSVVSSSGQVMISIGGGDQIGLAGVPYESFSAGWIVFA